MKEKTSNDVLLGMAKKQALEAMQNGLALNIERSEIFGIRVSAFDESELRLVVWWCLSQMQKNHQKMYGFQHTLSGSPKKKKLKKVADILGET